MGARQDMQSNKDYRAIRRKKAAESGVVSLSTFLAKDDNEKLEIKPAIFHLLEHLITSYTL